MGMNENYMIEQAKDAARRENHYSHEFLNGVAFGINFMCQELWHDLEKNEHDLPNSYDEVHTGLIECLCIHKDGLSSVEYFDIDYGHFQGPDNSDIAKWLYVDELKPLSIKKYGTD